MITVSSWYNFDGGLDCAKFTMNELGQIINAHVLAIANWIFMLWCVFDFFFFLNRTRTQNGSLPQIHDVIVIHTVRKYIYYIYVYICYGLMHSPFEKCLAQAIST